VNEDRVIADEGALQECYVDDVYGIRGLRDVEFALDVGAHIGGASALLHECFPSARIVAVECCPENMPCLEENVGHFADVLHGAVTYETGNIVLASTVYEGCRTSGSSVVVTREQWETKRVPWTWDPDDYHLDDRPLLRWTIEDIVKLVGGQQIDLLKLDCEGSEISILMGCSIFDRIRTIVGEYHDAAAFTAVAPPGTEMWDGHLFRVSR
jgi:FkbM family methyltransferase